MEDIDDRPGPVVTRKQADISVSCLPQARAGVQVSEDHRGRWTELRLQKDEGGGGTRRCPVSWLTAAVQYGPTGSLQAGLGRSFHPRPSSHSESSRRWPSRAGLVSLHGLSEEEVVGTGWETCLEEGARGNGGNKTCPHPFIPAGAA